MVRKRQLSSEQTTSERRVLLREWLGSNVNAGKFGLTWHDKTKTVIRIPWKHASKQDFDVDDDTQLFRAWAMHTNKYSKGDDPKKWKANFRCALHSLRRQIRFEASMSKSKGNSAFRMYRLLPVTTENQTGFRKRSSANRNKHVSEQSSSSSSGVESDEEQTESDFSSDPVQGEDDADIGLVADWIQSGELEIETIAYDEIMLVDETPVEIESLTSIMNSNSYLATS